ncbi:hypothetical protein X975_25530, partial [Stegodyphus mimosarum]
MKIYYDISTNYNRPYIPVEFQQKIVSSIHNLSHPGIRSRVKLITKCFIWPNMNKRCQLWTKACLVSP